MSGTELWVMGWQYSQPSAPTAMECQADLLEAKSEWRRELVGIDLRIRSFCELQGAPTMCRPSTGHWGRRTNEVQSLPSNHYYVTPPHFIPIALGGVCITNLSSQMRQQRLPGGCRRHILGRRLSIPCLPIPTDFPLYRPACRHGSHVCSV